MSDFHEMFENWNELGYDPAYVGERKKDDSNEPDYSDWERIDDAVRKKLPRGRTITTDDFDGGF